ncbi:GDP GTP exchange factor [Niveomyces insectorum RCEF 264]|uniref:GDP GTP exchange factor n=1 Tax=Niveomyces insectorum RCEF 264 TaxID=1081102 RepID=A0A167W5V3_9HYPO|nr:GDP GTP exchange factor [Niveomyces insectorum RCEF 264]
MATAAEPEAKDVASEAQEPSVAAEIPLADQKETRPDLPTDSTAPQISEPSKESAEHGEVLSGHTTADNDAEKPEQKRDEYPSNSPRPANHTHSSSYDPSAASLKEALSSRKANSTSELPTIAADDAGLSRTRSTPIRRLPSSLSSGSFEDQDRSTIPDPRTRSHEPPSVAGVDAAANAEITTLSTKLIDAINYQSTLDDTLSQTRMELDASREKIRKLEEVAARQKEFLAGGLWVRKSAAEEEKAQLVAKAREEKRLRAEAEEAKKKMELELENLTAELFQQANTMVSAAKEEARREQLAAAKRYDNLKAQLADTEGLLKSQQEQLAELKQVMEEMITAEPLPRDDQTTTLTTPTSPGSGHFGSKDSDTSSASDNADGEADKALEAGEAGEKDVGMVDGVTATAGVGTDGASPATTTTTVTSATTSSATISAATPSAPPPLSPDALPLSPSQPMSFTHLLRPVFRYDTAAFHEFADLIRAAQLYLMLQQPAPQSHIRSPSSTSLPKTPPANSTSWSTQALAPHSSSVAPITAVNAFSTVAAGIAIPPSGSSPQNHVKDLKESKFYKRVLVEDIEPTLRLDTAPGISWLLRRNIMAAILEGTLVAEPVSIGGHGPLLFQHPCSLCGESRREEGYLRRHRFRLTESDKSTPYPLCDYCLHRVRTVCGFLVFLRMIHNGHWRANDETAEHAAWEECVRLREQMFWARIGGGVLPANAHGGDGSPASSARHSRVAGGGSSGDGHNALAIHVNGNTHVQIAGGGGGGHERTLSHSPHKPRLSGPSSSNNNNLPVPRPSSSPVASSGGPGTATRGDNGSTNQPRPSHLSASVAAMISGMGGHIS